MKRAATAMIVGLYVLGAWAAAAGAAAVREAPIADLGDRATKLSGYGDVLAWSTWDKRSKRYRLTVRVGGEQPVQVKVPGRRLPFDVDVGPGRDERPLVAYSRCRREPDTRTVRAAYVANLEGAPAYYKASGCDLYTYSVALRQETRLRSVSSSSFSEYMPSVWRGNVAFVRRHSARGMPRPYLRPAGSRRSIRLAGGPVRHYVDGPATLDLRGRRLAYEWHSSLGEIEFCETTGDGPALYTQGYEERIRVVEPGRPTRHIAYACTAEDSVNDVGGAVWSGPELLLTRENYVGGRPNPNAGYDDFIGHYRAGAVVALSPAGATRELGTYTSDDSQIRYVAVTQTGMFAMLTNRERRSRIAQLIPG